MTQAKANNADQRDEQRQRFLKDAGWAEARAAKLAGDASTRSYERLSLNGRKALLMNAPLGAETASCPPNASPEERRALGYNAMARLAGPDLNAFVAVAECLRKAGLSAPEIYAADAAQGFALIEDFGDGLFAVAAKAGANEETLYKAAIDVLLTLREAAPDAPALSSYSMLAYDRTALQAEIGLVPEWYWPFKTGAAMPSRLEAAYFDAWAPVLDLLGDQETVVLRDFHAENLIWMPDRAGVKRVGVIDFQDGLFGHAAYDLVSLLEDARRDVAPRTVDKVLSYYCSEASRLSGFSEDKLRRDYAILGAQRNAKILGIFARLVKRDGKDRYLDFMPRVEGLFRHNLAHGELAPLQEFFAAHMPELTP